MIKLKDKTIKTYNELNEINNNLESSRQEKLTSYGSKIALIEQTITDETKKAIIILKNNEQQLKDDCKTLLKIIKHDLDSSSYKQQINESRETIEKDELNEESLNNLSDKISRIKETNRRSDYIKNYENKFEFNQMNLNENLSIGELKSVIYIIYNLNF